MEIAQDGDEAVYKEYKLDKLINPPKVKFTDFPLYYILGIVDTIEPVKHFCKDHSDIYILENVKINFREDGIDVANASGSLLDFKNYIDKVQKLGEWLDIEIHSNLKEFKLNFK